MRFTENGPSIPDGLLTARDAGDVIFFCGAGVSQARAKLPNFQQLGSKVITVLGAAKDSLASKLFKRAKRIGGMEGVGGLVATDRVFSLLEREFETSDVRAAVAKAIKPKARADLSAHRILLDLSRSRDGVVRLVTTNFDLLFEDCDGDLQPWGPPFLPDPRSDRFRGIVHLHGRVDADYHGPADEEFVISSGDFGRAYLSDGWATRFIQSLLTRFQIVFIGYTADDPPVQYLLEALRLRAGGRDRLFAFHGGLGTDGQALWEHRGVRAIPFETSKGFEPLWDTLEAWAERARDPDLWYARLLTEAAKGPQNVTAHVRGQIAHVLSTREGAHRISQARVPIPASWLLAMDARQRYARPGPLNPYDESSGRIDPYEFLALDSDVPPKPINEGGYPATREAPEGGWDAFRPNHIDQESDVELATGRLRGVEALTAALLPPRLVNIGIWLQRVAHDPVALWWAAQQQALHPRIADSIANWIGQEPARFPDDVKRGWRLLLAACADKRPDGDQVRYDLERRTHSEGWSLEMVRDYVAIFRPCLVVKESFGIKHPLSWTTEDMLSPVITAYVEYPHPYEPLTVPDEMLGYAISLFRGDLEHAKALNFEIRGNASVYFETTRADDGAEPIAIDSYGLTGPISHFQQLMQRLAGVDADAARAEIARWPVGDDGIFARLRIWAAGTALLSAEQALAILMSLSEEAFWGSQHQRDLLYAIRDRWPDFNAEQRAHIETQLRTGSYSWSEDVRGGPERAQAHHRLDRLEWLSSHNVAVGFDLTAEMETLRKIAPEWSPRSGAAAADSHAPVVRSVETDKTPDSLLTVPISEILNESRSREYRDIHDFAERRPFLGLSEEKPARAFAALRRAAKKESVPGWAWSTFLSAEKRKTDADRFARAIAAQLLELPVKDLHAIAYPVSEWMRAMGARFYDGLGSVFPALWDRMMDALALGGPSRKHDVESSWANDALNAPVGKLVDIVWTDPAIQSLQRNARLPAGVSARLDQLLILPGDMRRHALVMIGYQTVRLHAIDPAWTERQLLSVADDQGSDGDALWDGLLWRAHAPSRELFERIKTALLARALTPVRRRSEATIVAGFLLVGWGGDSDAPQPEQLITNAEFRQILVGADEDLRSQVLWQLQQWAHGPNDRWRGRVLPFLRSVWPHHRALRTPHISNRLAELASESGHLFPEVVAAILPRLVPVRGGYSRIMSLDGADESHPVRRFPAAMLDLLWAILAEDVSLWPYKIEDILDLLERAPETAADPRLSELRRRRAR
jgi:hypothetical protein